MATIVQLPAGCRSPIAGTIRDIGDRNCRAALSEIAADRALTRPAFPSLPAEPAITLCEVGALHVDRAGDVGMVVVLDNDRRDAPRRALAVRDERIEHSLDTPLGPGLAKRRALRRVGRDREIINRARPAGRLDA